MRRNNQTNWPLKKLKTIAEIVSGSTPKTSNKDYWNGNILWVTPKDLSKLRGKYIEETEKKITEAGYQSCSTTLVPAGSVLLSSRAPIGHLAIAKKELCTNQGFKTFLPKPELDSGYLYYALKYYMQEIKNIGRGAIFAEISKSMIENFEIPVPESYEDQIRIATLLSHVEAQIAARKESLKLLDELVKSAFLKMFGDPVKNEKGWEKQPLTTVCILQSGGTPSKANPNFWDGNLPWFSPKDLKKSDLWDSIDHINENVPAQTNIRLLPKDTVVIVVRGMILAHTFPVSVLRIKATINQDMKALMPQVELHSQFLAECLRSQSKFVLQQVSEAAHGTKRLDSEGLHKIGIILPPSKLQNKFAALVEKVEAIKSQYQQSLSELENLYASLSQRAFRGELDLSQSTYLTQHVQAVVAGKEISKKLREFQNSGIDLSNLSLFSENVAGSASKMLRESLNKILNDSPINTTQQISKLIQFHFKNNFDFDDLSYALNNYDSELLQDVTSYHQIRQALMELLEQEPEKLRQRFDIASKKIVLAPKR
ncbi:MAG: restriction endonuclease subunit S [Candidatus Sericytochromatia bacterium]|nr:restriction endonuclease subunit S [Candidatus Sericytochromatia bacterium]